MCELYQLAGWEGRLIVEHLVGGMRGVDWCMSTRLSRGVWEQERRGEVLVCRRRLYMPEGTCPVSAKGRLIYLAGCLATRVLYMYPH